MMFGLSYAKLIGFGLAALALLFLVAERSRWMHRAHNAEGQVAAACDATKEAAANPKLKCKDMPQQIRLLGTAITDLKVGITKQNAAVDALAAESERQKSEAEKAVLKAAGRAQSAEATAERLRASSRAGGASTGVCEPSRELQESWK